MTDQEMGENEETKTPYAQGEPMNDGSDKP